MSAEEGQEPPQVPHWMHISSLETPAVRAETSSNKVKSSISFGMVFVGASVWGVAIGFLFAHRLKHHSLAQAVMTMLRVR